MELVRRSDRYDVPAANMNEQMVRDEDLRGVRAGLMNALREDKPQWWLPIGESEWVVIVFDESVALARSPEAGAIEISYVGTLAGGSYAERWNDGDEFEMTFRHEQLPKPLILSARGANALQRHELQRAAFKRWAQTRPGVG